MENKNKSFLKISTILSWLIFFGLCVLVSEIEMNKSLELVISIFAIVSFVAAIVLSILLGKNKTKKQKVNVDDNILTGRKIYKKIVRNYFKREAKIYFITSLVILVPFLIYYAINFNKVMLICFAVSLVVVPAITLSTVYAVVKFFYFSYKEINFNGESFVLFSSKERLSHRYYDPKFHVVYNGREYVEAGKVRWFGVTNDALDVVDGILYQSVTELIDWFSDARFSNFIRIDVVSEKQGKIQCVYKLGTRKFIVTDKMETLKGCFETSRSMRAEQKKKKLNKKK